MTNEELNQTFQSLVNAINIAQRRGAYSLEESSHIHNVISALTAREEATEEALQVEEQQEET
tara:strand:- start:239 stop:424 length:186 start_codon:yes stop_codon:yes gene_type:complete